ncbi:MAG: transposase [Actinobacteria bacterium]|nr:transposase [Actinomycetota bacterium]
MHIMVSIPPKMSISRVVRLILAIIVKINEKYNRKRGKLKKEENYPGSI